MPDPDDERPLRRRVGFRQCDLERAIRAAKATGAGSVSILPNGDIAISVEPATKTALRPATETNLVWDMGPSPKQPKAKVPLDADARKWMAVARREKAGNEAKRPSFISVIDASKQLEMTRAAFAKLARRMRKMPGYEWIDLDGVAWYPKSCFEELKKQLASEADES